MRTVKKLLPFLLGVFLCSYTALATTLTGTIRDTGGNLITGSLYLELNAPNNVLSSGGCGGPYAVGPAIPAAFTLTNGVITGPGVGPYTVVGNDCMQTAGSYYKLTALTTDTVPVLRRNVAISGASVDIGALPTAGSGSGGSSFVLYGDVTGYTTSTTVGKIQGFSILGTTPTTNQALIYNGSAWAPGTPTAAVMTGASAGSPGTQGSVPAPQAGDQLKVLRGDATWATAGTGTVTSITQGTGMSFSSSPLTTTGTINLATPVAIANGGTNSTTAAGAVTNLGALAKDGTVPLTANWPAGAYNISSKNSVNWINVLAYGAVGDLKTVYDAGITISDKTLTSASNPWVVGDVGKIVTIRGAGASGPGSVLVTTIASFNNAGSVETTAAAAATVTNAVVNWGTDDTTAIQAALDALPSSGGVVYAPANGYGYLITAQLRVGNGTHTGVPWDTVSTINGIAFVGDNVGPTLWNLYSSANTGTPNAGTRICWGSTTADTMVMVHGPIEGVRIENMMLDANGLATGGLDVHRAFMSTFKHVTTVNWGGGYCLRLRANDGTYLTGGGAPKQNTFEQVDCMDPIGTTATGLQLGIGAGNACQNLFVRCTWLTSNNTSSPAADIQNSDHNTFVNCYGGRADGNSTGIGLQFTTQGGVQPSANIFFASTWSGGIKQNGTAVNNRIMSQHYPWDSEDSEPTPPNGANSTTLERMVAVGTRQNPTYQEIEFIGPFRFQNSMAVTEATVTLAGGLNSNIAIPDSNYIYITGPGASFSIGGFVVTTPGSRVLYVHNQTAYQMTIVNNDASSSTGNKIATLTGGDVVLRSGASFATFVYDTIGGYWTLTSTN